MGVIEGSELPHKRFEGISRAGWKYVGWLEMWDSSQESAPSLSLVIRGDQSQVVKLCVKCLYQLSHPAGLVCQFLRRAF